MEEYVNCSGPDNTTQISGALQQFDHAEAQPHLIDRPDVFQQRQAIETNRIGEQQG
jgi:hypothetical protein